MIKIQNIKVTNYLLRNLINYIYLLFINYIILYILDFHKENGLDEIKK